MFFFHLERRLGNCGIEHTIGAEDMMSQKNPSTVSKEHRQSGVGDCHTLIQSVLNELMKVLRSWY